MIKEILLQDIRIGQRCRQEMGDLQSLADSIAAEGLLQPIGITEENELVFGERRIRAAQRLEWKTITARIVQVSSIVAGEYHENEIRKDFTPSERVAIGQEVEKLLGNRQGQRTDLELPHNRAEVDRGKETRDIATQKAGFESRESYRQAKKVVEHGVPDLVQKVDDGAVSISAAAVVAEQSPEKQTQIVALDDEEILKRAKEIRERKTQENAAIRAKTRAEALKLELPSGKYRTIIVDPPWPMQKIERDLHPDQVGFDYPTMKEDELRELDIPGMAHDQSHLFLWTTQKFMPMALRLMDTWGFPYIFEMVWHKPGGFQPFGLPQYNCEFVLFGRKGALGFLDTKAFATCFEAPRREHSRKPEKFYDLIRRVCPGPRIDMFSRERYDGFDAWGVETEKFGGAT